MNLSFTYTDYFYSKFYCGRPTALADGTINEDKGCSPSDGTMFISVRGGTTLAFDSVSTPSVGWMTSSWRTPSTMLEWQASITHCAETCSTTIYVHGTKLSPSAWIASALQPSAYPL